MPLIHKALFIFPFSYSRNSINSNIIRELIDAFNLCDRDDRVRVVILTANPKTSAYCSGVRHHFSAVLCYIFILPSSC